MDICGLIRRQGENGLSLEDYLQVAKDSKIQYPLSPVKSLLDAGKVVLRKTDMGHFLIIPNEAQLES